MSEISATIITKNNAAVIRACLESIAWVNEIIVVDSGSTDETLAICREFGAHIYLHTDWPGFGAQKNIALSYATKPWIIAIDADERVTPELRKEIETVINQKNDIVAYAMPRKSTYCGRFINHSGWYPDYMTRLIKRGAASFYEHPIHDRMVVTGKVAKLKYPLLHYTFNSLEEMLCKMDRYSTGCAALFYRQGKTVTLFGAVLRGAWCFFRTYVLHAGFLDGNRGFMLAVSNAEGTYYKYLKLYLLLNK